MEKEKELYYIPDYSNYRCSGYFSSIKNAYILDYYNNLSLPLNGWLKNCINCYKICSQYIYIDYKLRRIIIPICYDCQKYKNIDDNILVFIKKFKFFIIKKKNKKKKKNIFNYLFCY